jgi:hypothetical protein
MNGLEPLINVGAVGAVLAWFMFRTEARLQEIEHAIEVMSKAILILAISNVKDDSPAKSQAEALLSDLGNKK